MSDGGRLAGKTALITGGAGGIGQAIAAAFLREGAAVMISDIDADAAGAAAEALAAEGMVVSCQHDVTSEDSWTGIWISGSVEATDVDTWRKGLSVNLDSVFLGTKLAFPLLRDSQPASIINLSSIAGIIAGHNIAAYNAAKAGVWMLTKSTALHAAHKGDDIRCNSIHPFFIDTGLLEDVFARGGERKALEDSQKERLAQQTPLKRLCSTDDVAYAAIYLASDESRFMTGSEIKLDGGLSAM